MSEHYTAAQIDEIGTAIGDRIKASLGELPPEPLDTVSPGGGPTSWYGPGNAYTVLGGKSNQELVQDRMYFMPMWVGRELVFEGGFISLYGAGSASSVIRAGLYDIGSESGTHCSVGDLITDMGTDSAGVDLRYTQWLTGNQITLSQWSSGASADTRTAGIASYVYENSQNTEIVSGLSTTVPNDPGADVQSTSMFTLMMFNPKWSEPV